MIDGPEPQLDPHENDLLRGTAGPGVSTDASSSSSLDGSVGFTPPETVIRIMQINAARSKYVTHQIENLLVEGDIVVCLIQEPVTDGTGIYLLDRRPYRVIAAGRWTRAIIVIANPTVGILHLQHLCTPNFAAAVITTGDLRLTMISAYFKFSEPMQIHADAVESITP